MQPKSYRSQSATTIVELACTAFLFIVFALLALDAGVLIMANSVLDEASRDAGRAAGETQNQSDAQNAANLAIGKHKNQDNPFLKNLSLIGQVLYQDVVPPIDSTTGTSGSSGPTGQPGLPPKPVIPAGQMEGTPFVQLTAGIDAVVPAPIFFFGARFGPGGTLHFESTTTFPIIKVAVPASGGVFDANPPLGGGGGGGFVPCPPGQPQCPKPPPGTGGPGGPGGSSSTGPPPGSGGPPG